MSEYSWFVESEGTKGVGLLGCLLSGLRGGDERSELVVSWQIKAKRFKAATSASPMSSANIRSSSSCSSVAGPVDLSEAT